MANAHFVILERWFGKDWREVYLILHEDSTLMWYSERGDSSPEGGVFLKDCPEMIAAGQVSIFLRQIWIVIYYIKHYVKNYQ